ncbi:response regulator transcription factor [Ideonella paludis]|uniref:Response regulator n=1 Tax=Ideonella paludis TaxID=1233411 RepID=A0ABS5DZ18_9BURK|nr:response regulator [Ideonella paludis]MBQ0936392.1 response regulator [Ideonella paludis]
MKRVLIVDDQADIRELVRMTLELQDYDLHEAANGEDGVKQAQALTPDLVLMDVMMPGAIDGIEACRRIRNDPRLKRSKVVILSAKARPEDRATGLAAGATDYLVKPFSPRELLQLAARLA